MEPKKLAKIGLGVLLVAGLIYVSDFSSAVRQLLKMDLLIYAVASAVFMVGLAIGGARWFLFNQVIEEDIDLQDSTRVYLLNYLLSTVFIGNLADMGRYKIQENYSDIGSKYAVTGAVIAEKIFDLVSVLSVIAVSLGFVYRSVSGLVLSGILATTKSFAGKMLGEGSLVIEELRKDRVSAVYISALSLAIWWLEAVAFHVIALSLGIKIGFFESAITTSVMSLASSLPITPSGLGTTESAGYAMLAVFSIASGPALALVVGQRFLGVVVSSLPGIMVYFSDYAAGS